MNLKQRNFALDILLVLKIKDCTKKNFKSLKNVKKLQLKKI